MVLEQQQSLQQHSQLQQQQHLGLDKMSPPQLIQLTPETKLRLLAATGLSPFDSISEAGAVGGAEAGEGSTKTDLMLISPLFDESDPEALEDALLIAAREAEEAEALRLPPPPPPPSTPLSSPTSSAVSDDDIASAANALVGLLPARPSTTATRGRSIQRSASLKRGHSAVTTQRLRTQSCEKKAKLDSKGQPKLNEKYFKEYAQNAQKLMMSGVSTEQQFPLEKGLDDPEILEMQRRKLASISMARNVHIAPKDAGKKDGPSK